MLKLRPLAALFLAFAVTLTSVAMGAARGQAMAVGEMVLCTGTGPVSVAVDAEGNPTGPAHYCPDCIAVAMATAPAAPMSPPARPDWRPVTYPATPPWVTRPAGLRAPTARGPPSVV